MCRVSFHAEGVVAASSCSLQFLPWFEGNPEKEVQVLPLLGPPSVCKGMAGSEQRGREGRLNTAVSALSFLRSLSAVPAFICKINYQNH